MTMKQLQTKKPWERWPNETDTAYDRFMAYLKMGADRSMPKVVEKYGMKKSYRAQLQRWSSKYGWVDRCKAYDEHIALQHVDNQEIIQKKTRSKVLARMDTLVDTLYKIAESDSHDRMDAIKLLLEQGGMITNEDSPQKIADPTYQQINNYFYNKMNSEQ